MINKSVKTQQTKERKNSKTIFLIQISLDFGILHYKRHLINFVVLNPGYDVIFKTNF